MGCSPFCFWPCLAAALSRARRPCPPCGRRPSALSSCLCGAACAACWSWRGHSTSPSATGRSFGSSTLPRCPASAARWCHSLSACLKHSEGGPVNGCIPAFVCSRKAYGPAGHTPWQTSVLSQFLGSKPQTDVPAADKERFTDLLISPLILESETR